MGEVKAITHYNWCIDVSHNNGVVDWKAVAAAGYKLVLAKATQGASFPDPQFRNNAQGASTNDIMFVPYHFISLAAAKAQADFFVKTAALRSGSPAMLDWESNDPRTLPPVATVEELLDRVRQVIGRDPLMYHGIYTLTSKKVNACPWHLPKYGPEPVKWKWLFWQNSAKSRVPGIQGFVDHDFFHGTEAQLSAWFEKGTLPNNLMGVEYDP